MRSINHTIRLPLLCCFCIFAVSLLLSVLKPNKWTSGFLTATNSIKDPYLSFNCWLQLKVFINQSKKESSAFLQSSDYPISFPCFLCLLLPFVSTSSSSPKCMTSQLMLMDILSKDHHFKIRGWIQNSLIHAHLTWWMQEQVTFASKCLLVLQFVGVSGQVMCIYPHQVKEMFTEGWRLLCLLIMSLEGWCHMPYCCLPLTNPYLLPIQAELFLASVLGLSLGSRWGASVASYTQALSHTVVFNFQIIFVKQVISELILMNNTL